LPTDQVVQHQRARSADQYADGDDSIAWLERVVVAEGVNLLLGLPFRFRDFNDSNSLQQIGSFDQPQF
jgi:hypothetical protein